MTAAAISREGISAQLSLHAQSAAQLRAAGYQLLLDPCKQLLLCFQKIATLSVIVSGKLLKLRFF